jgi:hypothetical protein
MKRWAVRVTIAVLVLISAGSVWMWIYSYHQTDQLRVHRMTNTMLAADVADSRTWYGFIRSSRGKVALMTLTVQGQWTEVRQHVRKSYDGNTRYGWLWGDGSTGKREPEWMMVPQSYVNRVEFLGFSYGQFERHSGYYLGASPNEVSLRRLLLVPWPAIVILFGFAPIWYVSRALLKRSRRKKRISQGLCPKCGYDLRATHTKCPECGQSKPTAPDPYIGSASADAPSLNLPFL